ncbi:type IV pilus modification PilV family protein [Arenimonas alkanexedens]
MRRQRGFSLLEVILAFALLSVGLGILIAILSGGLAQVRGAGDATEATLHAQSLLDEVGVLEPIEPGQSRGEFDGGRYRWELEITETEDPAPRAESGPDVLPIETVGLQPVGGPLLYRIQLDVSWGADDVPRRLRFATLRARYPTADQVLQ